MSIKLGSTVHDIITGFTGVVTGRVEYISRCNRILVDPKCKADGDLVAAQWFDEQRVWVDDKVAVVALDNGDTPGADKPAPVR